ncbi:MAG TPA: ABC transporter permease [Gaiellaceae bacterium]|nr:ABC transporter permease [Gaiellaceae bacterium]
MTDGQPRGDILPEDRETVGIPAGGTARPAAASASGPFAIPEEPGGFPHDLAVDYEAGVELEARSQWAYVRMRFVRHRLAMASTIVLLALTAIALLASQVAPYSYDELDLANISSPPTLEGTHWFGTDLLGRDYLSRVIYGTRTSLLIAFLVALVSTLIGTALGAVAGYYGGQIDNLLMRFTDLILTLPGLAVLLTAAAFLGSGDLAVGPFTLPQPVKVGLILALLFWTQLARIVRGLFLSLREKEFVEAAKAAGASDMRIIVRHILPNCVGPIVVTMTLVIATAILVEAALSFLGFGIQPPHPALGKLIAEGQAEGFEVWWLVTFPGLVIVVICLAINFIGDGLRDALDPTQRRVRA